MPAFYAVKTGYDSKKGVCFLALDLRNCRTAFARQYIKYFNKFHRTTSIQTLIATKSCEKPTRLGRCGRIGGDSMRALAGVVFKYTRAIRSEVGVTMLGPLWAAPGRLRAKQKHWTIAGRSMPRVACSLQQDPTRSCLDEQVLLVSVLTNHFFVTLLPSRKVPSSSASAQNSVKNKCIGPRQLVFKNCLREAT